MKNSAAKKFHIPKIRGITLRWIINILGVIALFFIIVFIISSFAIKNHYYSNVESILSSGTSTTATDYFSSNLDAGETLEQSAADFIDSYSYKDKTTIWVIDSDGKVVLSSSGFAIEKQDMPDYNQALTSADNCGKYIGKLDSNEKVMAVCRAIKNSEGDIVGAVRVMSSLEQIDNQVFTMVFIIFVGLLAVFAIIILSNVYFIQSIIIPVQEINETTKKISQGDYSVRIEKKYNDEIGNLCDSINSMAEEISTTDKMKNDFISTISHELRTPLTSIKGWGETLTFGMDDSVDEITRKGLEVIVKEAGRLEGFVEELLDFSRLQSGRMNLKLSKTDIFAELDETVFTFRERAMREGIEVKYSIPDVPAVGNADANRLRQVFMNILDNALKYSRAPSKIFVKAQFLKYEGKNSISIAVADQGCGISKEDLPHVKDKFYKANVSVRGSGIGLAVTNEIINLHQGKLEIDSEEGKGTLVTIYLPIESLPSENELQDMPANPDDAEINKGMEMKGESNA
ncbi:MAG: HAMP domain-containing protein [Eubacterium sp.]|nr:HAMP domain-containing protein [Eubacterium sp.]